MMILGRTHSVVVEDPDPASNNVSVSAYGKMRFYRILEGDSERMWVSAHTVSHLQFESHKALHAARRLPIHLLSSIPVTQPKQDVKHFAIGTKRTPIVTVHMVIRCAD